MTLTRKKYIEKLETGMTHQIEQNCVLRIEQP